MSAKERRMDRAGRISRRALVTIGSEVRTARRVLGASQDAVGVACGLSGAEIGRIERAQAPWLSVENACRVFAAVGLDLSVRGFAAAGLIRDSIHDQLLTKLETMIGPVFRPRREWPIPIPGDPRAIDLVLYGLARLIAVEAETFLDDLQNLQRRLELKRRDSGIERMILLIRDTERNRDIVRSSTSLRAAFPLGTRAVLSALRAGRDPGANGIVFL
jgi:transcriptional regulator with XRE-family HTH domain